MSVVLIGDRPVGDGAPVYIIAEAGSNHDRDLDQARRLVDAAAAAGADAVKFQTFTAERIVAETKTRARYLDAILPPDETMAALFRKLELPYEWHGTLKEHAEAAGLDFLSSAFDEGAVDLLHGLRVKAFKVATYELWHLPLIRYIARLGRPMICSTGMASIGEVEQAVRAVEQEGNLGNLVLLHCTVNYPPPFAELNLRAMATMRTAFGVPVGYSDHTPGWTAPVVATALGAAVIEKHFTTSRDRPGPDHRFALEPPELGAMIRAIRDAEASLGDGVKRMAPAEADLYVTARRSLHAARDIEAGQVLDRDAIAILRPGTGIEVRDLDHVVGRVARRRIERHEPLAWEMF
ncbi:MAG: N-acetylneuraminate synthase [Chloroflexi bacterium]|nr:N-acetylneuraminate synthase [Chloroflexota bacterium]